MVAEKAAKKREKTESAAKKATYSKKKAEKERRAVMRAEKAQEKEAEKARKAAERESKKKNKKKPRMRKQVILQLITDMLGSLFSDTEEARGQSEEGICMYITNFVVCVTIELPDPIAGENTCQSCGGYYSDDDDKEQACWIWCDEDCGWWFHYWCAGFTRKPRRSTKFVCSFCTS